MRRRLPLLAMLLGLLLPVGVMAASPDPVPLPTPTAGRAVYDTAGIWTTATIDAAELLLADLRTAVGTQVAVVSLATGLDTVTEAQAIGDASLVMKRFGVGTEGRNDGLVVLFDLDTTLQHGQIRIYPGYDLEAAGLPNDVAQAIFEQEMQPPAVAGDLDGALLGGLAAIDATLREASGPDAGGGTGAGAGTTGPGAGASSAPGPDEPVVIENPGVGFGPIDGPVGNPGFDPGAFSGVFIIAVLVAIAGIALSAITGSRGGGADADAATAADSGWWWSHRNNGPWDGRGGFGGGGAGAGGGGGAFGGGGDSGGSGGGGGAF